MLMATAVALLAHNGYGSSRGLAVWFAIASAALTSVFVVAAGNVWTELGSLGVEIQAPRFTLAEMIFRPHNVRLPRLPRIETLSGRDLTAYLRLYTDQNAWALAP